MRWAIFLWIFLLAPMLQAQKLVSYLSASHTPEALHAIVQPAFSEIPFDLVNGMIVVEASVNHQNAYFILDTGAPMLVLNRNTPLTEESTIGERDNLASSCSSIVTVGTSTVEHFRWGGIEKNQVEVLTVDLSHLEKAVGRPVKGLIGYQIFKDREIFIDYSRQRMLLLDPQKNILHRAVTPLETSPFSMNDHLPILQLHLGDQTLAFGIDTGSETNLIDDCVAAKIDAALFDTLKTEEIQGLDQKVKTVPVLQFEETRLGRISWKAQPYLVTELCHLKSTHGVHIDGLLGYDFFNHTKISINYPRKEIYFWSLKESM